MTSRTRRKHQGRHTLYQAARQNNPKHWSLKTRNWSPIGAVTLNPERDEVVSAATASTESMRLRKAEGQAFPRACLRSEAQLSRAKGKP